MQEWSTLGRSFMKDVQSRLMLRLRALVCVEGMGFFCMLRIISVIAFGVAVSIVGSNANAEPISFQKKELKSPSFMRIYGPAQPPYGFLRFCSINPQYCTSDRIQSLVSSERFDATPQRLSELDLVNRQINEAIAPYTDQEIYGVSEYWTLPTTRGDCEDYALLKREMLERRGWPRSALLLTVVRDELGEGHAVLTVRTKHGDFVLDNKTVDVRLWSDMPYHFVMRQSYVNPLVWVSLDKAYSNDNGLSVVASGSGNN